MDTIDITPLPEGLRQAIKLFREQVEKSNAKIAEIDRMLDNQRPWGFATPELFEEGLEAIVRVEQERIEAMLRGIESCEQALGEQA